MCDQQRLRSASHLGSLISLCCPLEDTLNPWLPREMPCEDSDQTAWLCRLIWVFAGHTCNLVGNAVPQLICNLVSLFLVYFLCNVCACTCFIEHFIVKNWQQMEWNYIKNFLISQTFISFYTQCKEMIYRQEQLVLVFWTVYYQWELLVNWQNSCYCFVQSDHLNYLPYTLGDGEHFIAPSHLGWRGHVFGALASVDIGITLSCLYINFLTSGLILTKLHGYIIGT